MLDPFLTLLGGWAVACGALAANGFDWSRQDILVLAQTFLLVCLAWAGFWNLIADRGRLHLLAGRPPANTPAAGRQPTLGLMPFVRPGSPAQRIAVRVGRWLDRWRPHEGAQSPIESSPCAAWVSLLMSVLLAATLTLLLPVRLALLNAAFLIVAALGAAQASCGRSSLLGCSVVSVGLGWLAGHLVMAPIHWPSAVLALLFAAAVWGALRCSDGRRGGVWLLDAGQASAAVLLAVLNRPLAAGAVGLLLAGEVAFQPSLRLGREPAAVIRRTWPWLLVAMMISAWAIS